MQPNPTIVTIFESPTLETSCSEAKAVGCTPTPTLEPEWEVLGEGAAESAKALSADTPFCLHSASANRGEVGKLPGGEGRGSSGVRVRKGFLTTLALSSNGCFSKYLAPKRVKCAGW